MTDRELMQMALEALELLAKYENPLTKVQVRKPRDGGPIVTMYPHKVATDAAAPLRERLAREEYPEGDVVGPCICGSWPGGKCLKCPRIEPARQEQEPVAWHEPGAYGNVTTHKKWAHENGWTPLYTAPQPCPNCASLEAQNTELDRRLAEREWVGLTDKELAVAWDVALDHFDRRDQLRVLARAIEAKLREKNA